MYLRKVESSDADLLYEWANDPTVRKNSFHTEPIPYESHIKWFQKMMKDEDVLLLILMDGEIPVGQIRLNISGEEAEIGYSIAAGFRGKGYGHVILRLLAGKIKAEYPEIKRLIAKVKPDNPASNKLFADEGYSVDYFQYSWQVSE